MELGAACGERAADAVLPGYFLAHPAQGSLSFLDKTSQLLALAAFLPLVLRP